MKHLLLLVSLIHGLPIAAFADGAQDACKNSAVYDRAVKSRGGTGGYGEFCRKTYEKSQQVHAATEAAMPKAGTIDMQGSYSQAGAAERVAQLQTQGGAVHARNAETAAKGAAEFKQLAEGSQKAMASVESDRAKISPALNPTGQEQLRLYALASAQEFKVLAESDAKKANHYAAEAAKFRASAQRFQGSAEQNAEVARRLAGDGQVVGQQNVEKQFVQNQYVGEDKKTVSADTWVGLGGAALITAGAVGGLYLIGNKLVKKGDKAAEMRIAQAEESANRVIKNAEDTAKRIIEFAVSSAGKIISNVEEAANRIYEKAKEDVQKLIGDLTEEVKAQFKNLSTEGLKKLRGEFESMFAGLIEKASKEGNSALVSSLTKAWQSLAATIDTEISSRVTSATSTSTSTSTGSSTSVSTSSSTSTASSTSTSSATSSSTASSTSTSTSSKTSSSSATYTGTYTSNRI